MDSDLPKYCFFRLQSFLGKITDAKNIIKTEHADEDPKVSSVEFISARLQLPVRKAGILAKQEVLVKTPDWLCKKYKIDQEDTFTRKVDHIPATADREAMSVWETLVRAMIGSETAKMLKSMGIPEMAKEEFEKEKHSVQEFLTGGPNPSTQAAISKEQFWKRQMRREELKIIREMKRKTMKRRIMTRKTAEREKRKSEAMENPPKKQIWDSERKINIKTEPTDEEFPEGASEFFAAIKAHPNAKNVVKTPDWFCKKHGITQRDTLTRIIGYVPATADHGPLFRLSTIGRALVDDEAVKMIKDSGVPEITTQDFEKDPLFQKFFLGGPKPSTRLVLGPSGRLMTETEGMQREKGRKSMKLRTMTRKTTERENRKREIMESKRVGREMTVRERMERKRIEIEKTECLSFAFQCTYCGHQSNRLTSLKDHVLGTRTNIDRSRCLQIDCINRLIQDGLLEKYEEDAIPVTCPPPKKQPWAKITCKDPKLIDSEGKFDIPEDIAKEWLKFFREMPT